MYNLIEYSVNYLKTCGSLWQYYRDEPPAAIVNSKSFKPKNTITKKIPANGNKMMLKLPLKYLKQYH